MKLPLIRNMRSEVGNILVVSSSQFTCYISYPGQLKIKYPDVTGDFIFVDLVKGGTGLGKFKIGVCKLSRHVCLLFCVCFLTSWNSHPKRLWSRPYSEVCSVPIGFLPSLMTIVTVSFFFCLLIRSEYRGRKRCSGKSHFRRRCQTRRAGGEKWTN